MEYYLAHHGVKGQKWGVRRYQNADGSLTDAGRRRAIKSEYRSAKSNIRRASREALRKTERDLSSQEAYGKILSGERYRRSNNASTLRYYEDKAARLKAKSKMNRELAENSSNSLSKNIRTFKSNYESGRAKQYSQRAKEFKSMVKITDDVYKKRLSTGEKIVAGLLRSDLQNAYYSKRSNASAYEAAGQAAVNAMMTYIAPTTYLRYY